MNNHSNSTTADVASLIVSIILLVAFLALSWMNVTMDLAVVQVNIPGGGQTAISLVGDWVGGDITDLLLDDLGNILLIVVLLCTILAATTSALGLMMKENSRVTSYGTAAAGAAIFLSCLVFYLNNLGSEVIGTGLTVGIAYWMTMLGSMILMGQAAVARPGGRSGGFGIAVIQQQEFVVPVTGPAPPPAAPPMAPPVAAPTRQAKDAANAWLINEKTQERYQVYYDQTRLGRSRKRNDIVLDSSQISREHALIREANGQFMIYDRAATAGVRVNDQLIRGPAVLDHGDRITLGDITLQFVKAK